jgi:hypothetical protein
MKQPPARLILPILVVCTAAAVMLASSDPQAKGRYKKESAGCVWVANDSGPNQCAPVTEGRFKKNGDACVWDSADRGPDQCTPKSGRFKKEGDKCLWSASDTGPNQCNPRQPK